MRSSHLPRVAAALLLSPLTAACGPGTDVPGPEASAQGQMTADGPSAEDTPSAPAPPPSERSAPPRTDMPGEGLENQDGGAAVEPTGAQPSSGDGTPSPTPNGMRDVLLVGNSVAGTVSVIDSHTFESLGEVDIIPDLDEVMAQIALNPVHLVAYPVVKNQQLLHHFEPGDGDRFVDDVFVTPDGATLIVSRSNLADVAAFDLTEPGQPLLWRSAVEGFKADHAALSPDGTRLVVSATTARKAQVMDTRTGAVVGSFPTGYYPHQNDYTPDGRFIYNASIGNVGYNAVSYEDNDAKGDRWLVKVDAETLEVVQTWIFEWGIRPSVFSADGQFMYAQLSYLNGVIKYDLWRGMEVARSEQDLSEFALSTYATYDEYPHDSAHHGLALSGDGTRLCDCGTIDNNVAIVRTEDMSVERTIDVGMVPYWASTGPEGDHCFVSMSGDDSVTVIEYATGEIVADVPVGDFPQRNRLARLRERDLDLLQPPAN